MVEVTGLNSLRIEGRHGSQIIRGKAVLNINQPTFVTIRLGRFEQPLFLFPEETVQFHFSKEGRVDSVTGSARSVRVNEYLLAPAIVAAGGGFHLKDEGEYLEFMDAKFQEAVHKLAQESLPDVFMEMEKQRLHAKVYTSLVTYPAMRRRQDRSYNPSAAYLAYAEAKLFENNELLILQDYQNLLRYLSQLIATAPVKPYSASKYALESIKWSLSHFKDPDVRTYLVNHFAFDYLKRHGQEDIQRIKALFDANVTDPILVNAFYDKYRIWENIQPGQPVPPLEFTDLDGRPMDLSAFRGKYVYIDVWATWCVPCVAEIPNLLAMKDSLKNNNIEILSISIDKDRDAWVKMVREDNFQGHQWHSGTSKFSELFSIASIPRFILIGPAGEIVDPNAIRPHRPEIYEMLYALKGF